jgi:hypothetical protein
MGERYWLLYCRHGFILRLKIPPLASRRACPGGTGGGGKLGRGRPGHEFRSSIFSLILLVRLLGQLLQVLVSALAWRQGQPVYGYFIRFRGHRTVRPNDDFEPGGRLARIHCHAGACRRGQCQLTLYPSQVIGENR